MPPSRGLVISTLQKGKLNKMIERKFCLLINPIAGNGQAIHILKKVEEALTHLSVNFRTVITENVQHAQQIATQAITRGEYIAIVGGDGTARAIAGILNELDGVLAVIPAGRGNDLVRMLKIPLDPVAACTVLASGVETTIDMGKVNNQPFLGICSLGFDSIANQLANKVRLIKGRAVYLYGGLRTLLGWKSIKFNLNIDGNAFEHIGYTVAVANSQIYGGGMYLAPTASMKDGLLDVVLIGNVSKFRMLLNFPRVFKGTHTKEAGFEIMHGRNIKIDTDSRFTIFADGDSISSPPANIQIIPNALRVLVQQ